MGASSLSPGPTRAARLEHLAAAVHRSIAQLAKLVELLPLQVDGAVGELLDGAETRNEVLGALSGSEFAQRELADAVEAHCREHAAGAPSAGAPLGDDDIELAGRLVAEDLMLMERRPEGWVLTAACLCFPSRWALADKLGRRIEEIHAPVPGLNDRLAPKISQFFDKLAPGKLVEHLPT